MIQETRKRVANLLAAAASTDTVWSIASDLEPEEDSQDPGAGELRELCGAIASKMEEADSLIDKVIRLLVNSDPEGA